MVRPADRPTAAGRRKGGAGAAMLSQSHAMQMVALVLLWW